MARYVFEDVRPYAAALETALTEFLEKDEWKCFVCSNRRQVAIDSVAFKMVDGVLTAKIEDRRKLDLEEGDEWLELVEVGLDGARGTGPEIALCPGCAIRKGLRKEPPAEPSPVAGATIAAGTPKKEDEIPF